ncbi:propeptide PepSY amd peptidase M4 [Bacillus cereus]|nr:propeptide PepSY amd peptidase M4 [Bacillus cereus]
MKKWIFTIIIVIVASGIYGAYVYNKAMEKKLPKEAKSVEIAKEKAKLTKVKSVDYYNGNSSYTVVQGIDEKGEQIIVWVPNKKGNVLVKKKSEGISEKEALQKLAEQASGKGDEPKPKPKEITKVKLGAQNDIPLWEITYIDQEDRYTYYYLEFQNGVLCWSLQH